MKEQRFGVYLDPKLKKDLQAWAREDERSLSNHIAYRLRELVDAYHAQKKDASQ